MPQVSCVLSGVTALVLYAVDPPPVTGGEETLRFIAGHKASYVIQQILWLVPSLFGLLVFVALLVVRGGRPWPYPAT